MKRCLRPECKGCIWRVNAECVHPDCRPTEFIEDCLIVAYDCCSSDTPTISVVRKEGDGVKVVNTIQGNNALYTYALLTGNAEWKEKKTETNADKIRSMNDEELAEFLTKSKYNNKEIDMDEICHKGMCLDGETCTGCMLKWLKRPIIKE